ncbi:MAG: PEP-CTERM sorting domain-containing protein [Acidobacteriota bacterium]|nr:PEP-CTERM sorting domain-containing protein [Acidobacteriota bacterium]
MNYLRGNIKKYLALVAPAILFAMALPAHATSFNAAAYYVGVEDSPVSGFSGGDKDYNDFVFTLSGAGVVLNSNGTLSNPIMPNDSASPFWNNLSSDGTAKNFGNCLYTPASNPCTGAAPIDPSAKYLSNGGDFAGFDFSGATGSVTLTIDAALHAGNDVLSWCTDPMHCHVITSGGTFAPGAGTYFFAVSFDYTYTSENSNFAAAFSPAPPVNTTNPIQPTPEPLSLALTGSGLLGLFFVRQRQRPGPVSPAVL